MLLPSANAALFSEFESIVRRFFSAFSAAGSRADCSEETDVDARVPSSA
jgi:hypothetical protein